MHDVCSADFLDLNRIFTTLLMSISDLLTAYHNITYITIPVPSAEVAITNTRRKVDHVLLHSGLHVSSFKTT